MKLKRLAVSALVATLIVTQIMPNLTKAETTVPNITSKVYRMDVQTGLQNQEVILTLGDSAYSTTTTGDGYLFVMTEKRKGFFYIEFENVLTKYYFEDGVVIDSEEVSPSIISIVGNTEVAVGDTLHLKVNAKPVTSAGNLKYLWYKDGEKLHWETGSTLEIENVSIMDAGNYSVEVFQEGTNGAVTRSSDQQVIVTVGKEVIEGNFCCNVEWKDGGVSQQLNCRSITGAAITYTIADVDCAVLDGNTLHFSSPGNVRVLASDGTNSIIIDVSCNRFDVKMDGIKQSFTYDGLQHPFDYTGVDGIKEFAVSYRCVDSEEDYSYEAPVKAGRYCTKIEMTATNGETFLKFLPITISQRELSIFNLSVAAKEYDKTASAILKGELIGVLSGDVVKLSAPIIKFDDANVGKKKGIKIVSGKLKLIGRDAENYSIQNYDVAKLTGRIFRKAITIRAVNKSSTEGEVPAVLTYTTSGKTGAISGVRIDCAVTEDSKAGKYLIKISGKQDPNYKITWVNGTYTVLPNPLYNIPEESYGITGTGSDDFYDDPYDNPYTDSTWSTDNTIFDDNSDTDWEDWTEWDDFIKSDDDADQDREEDQDNEDKNEDTHKITPYMVSNSLLFDGLSQINKESVNSSLDTLVIDYWITKEGNLRSVDSEIKLRLGKKGRWSSELEIRPNSKVGCYSAKDLILQAKSGKNIIKVVIKKYLCDLDAPEIIINGLEKSPEIVETIADIKQQNQPVTITVDTVYGVAGRSILAYKLVSPNSEIDTDSDDWKPVKQNAITIDQEFAGQIAILARDKIGNESVVYTEPFRVDTVAPEIKGIESDGSYSGRVSYNVTDSSGVASVTFDGKSVSTDGSILGGGLHTIVATDINGNSKSLTFTVEDTNFLGKILHSFKAVEEDAA